MDKSKLLREFVLIALFATILFVQQYALAFIPNVSLNALLILLFTKTLGIRKTTIIIILEVFAYNFLSPYGGLALIYLPFQVFAWFLYSVIVKISGNNISVLSVISFVFGFIYGWILIIPALILYDVPFIPYLISDIPFEMIMALSNFITVFWLFERMHEVLDNMLNNYFGKVDE